MIMLQAAIEKLSRGYMLADLVSIIGNVSHVSMISLPPTNAAVLYV